MVQSRHRPIIIVESVCFLFPQIMAQPLTWLPLATVTMGMYLMNGYSVVKERPFTVTKQKTGEKTICSFTCFLT